MEEKKERKGKLSKAEKNEIRSRCGHLATQEEWDKLTSSDEWEHARL